MRSLRGRGCSTRTPGPSRRRPPSSPSLHVYAGLLGGQPFRHDGEFYRVRPPTEFSPPPPVQRPHPPVWCVGALVPGRARQRSLERAARGQGVFPAVVAGQEGHSGLTPESLREIVDRLAQLRATAGAPWSGYDVVVEGDTHGGFGEVRGPVQDWAEAGATWWVESWWDLPDSAEGRLELRRRVAGGPPR